VDVLFGLKKWSDFERRKPTRSEDYSGESCSDIEDPEPTGQRPVATQAAWSNKGRVDYTSTEQRKIVAYLVIPFEVFLKVLL
jgi:hypothetical protein